MCRRSAREACRPTARVIPAVQQPPLCLRRAVHLDRHPRASGARAPPRGELGAASSRGFRRPGDRELQLARPPGWAVRGAADGRRSSRPRRPAGRSDRGAGLQPVPHARRTARDTDAGGTRRNHPPHHDRARGPPSDPGRGPHRREDRAGRSRRGLRHQHRARHHPEHPRRWRPLGGGSPGPITRRPREACGEWLVGHFDSWWRFSDPIAFWWMHAMVVVWALFALALFVAESLFLHARFDRLAAREPARALSLARHFHRVLAALALLTPAAPWRANTAEAVSVAARPARSRGARASRVRTVRGRWRS